MQKTKKLKLGIYGITGCAGCQLTVLFTRNNLLNIIDLFELTSFPFGSNKKYEGEFDIVLMEGLVASKEDLKVLQDLRKRTKIMVAVGACACHGCVPAVKPRMGKYQVESAVYPKVDFLKGLKPEPIDAHVKVDLYIPGCPPDETQLAKVLTDVARGKHPYLTENPVCAECTMNENDCLLEKGLPCMGPISNGGCNAVCVNFGHPCIGCRGPTPDANIEAYIKLLKEKGYADKETEDRVHMFANYAIDKVRKEKH